MFSISLSRLYDLIGDRTEVLGGGGDKTKQTKADDEPAQASSVYQLVEINYHWFTL